MKSSSRVLGALALVTTLPLLLSACAPSGPTYKLADLSAIAKAAPAPDYYAVSNAAEGTIAARDSYQKVVDLYKAADVTPAACANIAAVEGLSSAADFKSDSSDKIQELVRYSPTDAPALYESLFVRGRIFKDTASATKFLVAVRNAAGACANGYSVQAAQTSAGSTPAFKVDGVAISEVEDLPASVKGTSIVEISSDGSTDPSFRVSYLQRGNAVIAITSGIREGASVNYMASNKLVADIAKKFAANSTARG